ncbi:MAG: sigma-54-dependent Fis family transcriptional regulator [Burkholderiales bacterium]|nr:MAG: sigma-54-dependent Fis family transcriptional regulator [Burkholderiales bacterium]
MPGQQTSDPTQFQQRLSELASRLRFSLESGHIWLGEQRMLLMHGASIEALRKELIDSLGIVRARGVLTRIGFASGARDAAWARELYPQASDTELLGMGPMLHTLEGIVHARADAMTMDIARGVFDGEFTWESSYEADVHCHLYGVADEPACWMQVGYASGYSTTLMGRLVLFRETTCRAAGAACCHIVGRTADEWPDAAEQIRLLEPDSIAEAILRLQAEVRSLRRSLERDTASEEIVGRAPAVVRAWELVRKAAPSQVTVLLLGETGVGKEMFARALHAASTRAQAPFVAVNCAALPETLIESELFGVEKGAFTGAHQSRPGRFERAQGGTLFLDEVGELPAQAQAKLLRVLQEGEFERVGDLRTRKVDVRVVAATNVDLERAVAQGAFRRDLYYRLNVYPVVVPPLRERPEDIPELVRHFVDRSCARHGKHVLGVTDRALHALRQYAWPGNVRELENVIERGVILAAQGAHIDLDDLFPSITAVARGRRTAGLGPDGRMLRPDEDAVSAFLDHVARHHVGLDEVESLLIDAAVAKAGGNLSSAARALGITRPQLAYRLKKRAAPVR